MLMLALMLILKVKGGKQHCLPFVGSNLGVEIFLKKREYQKRMGWNRAPLYTFYWGFKKILCKACLLFNCFLVIKRILKALFSFIPWLLNFSDLPSYGSYLRKRYTLRLLSKCLGRSITPIVPIKHPHSIPSSILLDGPLHLYFN